MPIRRAALIASTTGAFFIAASPVSAEINERDIRQAETVYADFEAASSQRAGGYVNCPAGHKVFNGGALWWRDLLQPTAYFNLQLTSSTPTFDGTGWYADGRHATSETWNLRVIARCLPEGKLEGVKLRTETAAVSAGDGVDRRVSCPDGTRIISGGAFWHPTDAGPDPTDAHRGQLASSAPTSARSWYAAGQHSYGGSESRGFTVAVRCLKSRRLSAYERQDSQTSMWAYSSWAASSSCDGRRTGVGPSGVYFHEQGKPPSPSLGGDIQLSALGAEHNHSRYISGGFLFGRGSLVREEVAFCLGR